MTTVDAEGNELMKEGDSVVLYGSREKSYVLARLTRGATTACAFGAFPHELFIGKPFGSRVVSPVKQGCVRRDGQNGWVWALRLTSELWSRFLPHRTQVLYSADIAMIVFYLGIVPGCVAVESGTGSGSLTFALAKAAGPSGRVYTYDFHQLRATEARKTFAELGMDNIVVSQADACNDGFLHPADGADLRGRVDGVFLDLPSPWDAVKHADAVLRPGGMFCSFSPCIEQVQRTCLELVADSKFHSLFISLLVFFPTTLSHVSSPCPSCALQWCEPSSVLSASLTSSETRFRTQLPTFWKSAVPHPSVGVPSQSLLLMLTSLLLLRRHLAPRHLHSLWSSLLPKHAATQASSPLPARLSDLPLMNLQLLLLLLMLPLVVLMMVSDINHKQTLFFIRLIS